MMLEVDPLRESARVCGEKCAIVDHREGSSRSYAELDERVDRLVAGMHASGLSAGDRVLVAATPRLGTVEALHAFWRLGAIAVPVNPDLPEDRIQRRRDRIEPADTVYSAEPAPWETIAATPIAEFSELGESQSANLPDRDIDRTAALLFTSGSTGESKPVTLTHRALATNAIASGLRLGISPDDRWLDVLPLYHMGGLSPIFRSVYYGTGVVLDRFDTDGVVEAIETRAVTGVSLVPILLEKAMAAGAPLSQLRCVLVGGDRTPASLVRTALEKGIPIHTTYGATETCSQAATATPSELRHTTDTVGHPLRWTTIDIVDSAYEPVDAGTTGEIVVSGPAVSPGYADSDDDRLSDGRFRTGDLGYRDATGRLYVTGRADDRIVTGGETVDARLIEEALQRHPGVCDAAVVGIPDPEWGERVGAVLVSPGPTDPETIVASVRSDLTSSELPREVRVVGSIPRTPSGTIDRVSVREILRGERRKE